mgnify:CR=1 FL=1
MLNVIILDKSETIKNLQHIYVKFLVFTFFFIIL